MKAIALFNNKAGVGKTALVYHLAWMLADRGVRTLAVDLDPQANLTSMFLEEDQLQEIWPDDTSVRSRTLYGAVAPFVRGVGDIDALPVERLSDTLGLLPGDLLLSTIEDKLSDAWPRCLTGDEAAFGATTAFHQVARQAAEAHAAQIVLIDVGPNLGAINRTGLIAADKVVIPLGPDLLSLQGLKNLGPRLRQWRRDWQDRIPRNGNPALLLPDGAMMPIGYVVTQHGIRDSQPPKAYLHWIERFPPAYREYVLEESAAKAPDAAADPYCLAMLKHYRSLMPLAMEARKPMFFLKAADGAIGAHGDAVRACYKDFLALARRVAAQCGVAIDG